MGIAMVVTTRIAMEATILRCFPRLHSALVFDRPIKLIERLKPLVMENNLVEIIAGQHLKMPNATELLAFGPDDD